MPSWKGTFVVMSFPNFPLSIILVFFKKISPVGAELALDATVKPCTCHWRTILHFGKDHPLVC